MTEDIYRSAQYAPQPQSSGADNPPAPEPMWGKVEIFGHRKHFGRLSEIEQFGTKMLRVDVPLAEPDKFATFFYGGSSIFGITPMTEEAARQWAAHYRSYDVEPVA